MFTGVDEDEVLEQLFAENFFQSIGTYPKAGYTLFVHPANHTNSVLPQGAGE